MKGHMHARGATRGGMDAWTRAINACIDHGQRSRGGGSAVHCVLEQKSTSVKGLVWGTQMRLGGGRAHRQDAAGG